MIPSRRRDRPIKHLEWRVRFFAAGALLALAGIFLEMPWLVNVALVVLVLGFLFRFMPEAGESPDGDEDGEDPDGSAA